MSKTKLKSQIVVRVPTPLKDLIQEYLKKDTHKDISEFVRDACRQKIRDEAPDLYKNLFKEELEK